MTKHQGGKSQIMMETSLCVECGDPTTKACSFCGDYLCSRQKNPKCYYEHSQTKVADEHKEGTLLQSKRHTLNGVHPKEFMGDSAQQGAMYGQESGLCCICQQETTKRCKHCRKYTCRPSENSTLCMAAHLKNAHAIQPMFGIP